eukprot:g28292.t1
MSESELDASERFVVVPPFGFWVFQSATCPERGGTLTVNIFSHIVSPMGICQAVISTIENYPASSSPAATTKGSSPVPLGGTTTVHAAPNLQQRPSRPVSVNDTAEYTVLFFPDPALPCRFGSQCKRRKCNFAHQPTSLTKLLDVLTSARRTMDVCVFNITCDEIADTVLAAHKRGVRVRVITDKEQQKNPGNDISRMREIGIEVRQDNSQHMMHHKFAVVDGARLATGSFNWTRAAVLGNKENVIITTAKPLVTAYSTEFDKLWNEFKGK